jgi:amino acid transporter, AAT family
MSLLKYKFKKTFGFAQLFAIAIGGTISSTFFLGNGYLLKQLGPFAFLAYIAGGLITYLTMNAMAELAANEEPTHLSFVKYSYDYLSPSIACGVGYSYFLNWILYIPTECISGGFLLNALMPDIPIIVFALSIAVLILMSNLLISQVFAKFSEGLTYTHLIIFAVFSIMAVMIFLGFSGSSRQFLGSQYILPASGPFPNGFKVFFLNGIIMLLNFQGAEILGLAASETIKAKHEIPKVMKELPPTVTLLYVIPMLLLAMIYPWNNPPIEGSIFSKALGSYGFKHLDAVFSVLIVFGALSVSNSGIYASSRCAHALAHYKMLPEYFLKLSKNHVLKRIAFLVFTLIVGLLIATFLFPSVKFFELLLELAGFSGTFAWIAICLAQLKKRSLMNRREIQDLYFKSRFHPWGSVFAVIAMLFCMLVLMIDPSSRRSLVFGVLTFLIPFLVHVLRKGNRRAF